MLISAWMRDSSGMREVKGQISRIGGCLFKFLGERKGFLVGQVLRIDNSKF